MNTSFLQYKFHKTVFIITAALVMIVLFLIFQKLNTSVSKVLQWPILYYHLPLAINTFFAYFMVMVCSVCYLKTRNEIWDIRAHSIAEVGTIFCFLVLVTGSIWGRLNWGVFWSWEPRLVSMLLLFIIYIVYFMVRQFGGHYEQSSKLAAVVGILAFIDVPIIYYAVDMWSPEVQLHPQRNIRESDPTITWILPLAIISFTFVMASLFLYRYHIEKTIHSKLYDSNE